VRIMLGAAERANRLPIVADHTRNATAAADLAAEILHVPVRVADVGQDRFDGVFRVAAKGCTSWHGLRPRVFAAIARPSCAAAKAKAITTVDWPSPAHRLSNSPLNCSRLARALDIREWQKSVMRRSDPGPPFPWQFDV
jgi:dTDP-4-dehydrorhamnose reductase